MRIRIPALCVAFVLAILIAITYSPPVSAGDPIIDQYYVWTESSAPMGISAGPDGAIWFTEHDRSKIGRITTEGWMTDEYDLPSVVSGPAQIVSSGGALWFTEHLGGRIGTITTDGTITELNLPVQSGSAVYGISRSLWYADGGRNVLGHVSGATLTEIPAPGGPTNVVDAPGGGVWFTEYSGNEIGYYGGSGSIVKYAVPTPNSHPLGITIGPDGAIWFTENAALDGTGKIGRLTSAGQFNEFPLSVKNCLPIGITTGPDGALWFAEKGTGKLGRITTAGVISEYTVPNNGDPYYITTGPDGKLWFTESRANRIGRATIVGNQLFLPLIVR
jgi:virginiamycin B lyase